MIFPQMNSTPSKDRTVRNESCSEWKVAGHFGVIILIFVVARRMINHKAMSLPDRMTLIRNSGVYVQSLSSLVDNLVGPTLQMLVDREQYNQSMVRLNQIVMVLSFAYSSRLTKVTNWSPIALHISWKHFKLRSRP